MKNKEHYQQLTFEVLDKLMENEAKKGHSKVDLSIYQIGCGMRNFLESKGFIVYISSKSNHKSISW